MTTKETKIGGIHSAFFFYAQQKPTQSVGFCCELVNNLIIQFEDDNNE